MRSIAREISRAIKEAKWLYLIYENKSGETTKFWASIKDIDIDKKLFLVDMFNSAFYDKDNDAVIESRLHFSSIKKATVMEETTYDVPSALYQKLETSLHDLDWLAYDQFDDKILNYLRSATEKDSTPYRTDRTLVDGIDEQVLLNQRKVSLNHAQVETVIKDILNMKNVKDRQTDTVYTIRTLALNDLSIQTRSGLFVIAYYPVLFNPKDKSLSIADSLIINQVFFQDGFTHNLTNYLDIDKETFLSEYETNKLDYKTKIENTFVSGEHLVEEPILMELARDIKINLKNDYEAIVKKHHTNELNTPLKAFFGNMNQKMKLRKEPDIVVLDERVNIDQLRVIHNALKQYITYVQGPPGTGKTQTILNVLISAFFNDETALIASANNHPLNSIMEKMREVKYKQSLIPFPILRLGNNDYLLKALDDIKTLYERYKRFTVFEQTLDSMKREKSQSIESLNTLLDRHEDRLELEEKMDVLKTFKKKSDQLSRGGLIVDMEIDKLKAQMDNIPKITNEEALKHVQGADESFYMWLNFMSIKRIQRLAEPRYKTLFDIIRTDDEDKRLKAFKAYLKDKNEFRNLKRVFPFIVSTLHSVPKLGPTDTTFDLTIIDEAGQANIAISLPALLRGERLLLVGDPNQLNPIVTIDPGINEMLRKRHKVGKTYDFRDNSILKTMQTTDQISKFVLLRYHYRCQAPIINFSNRKYYDDALIIETKDLKDTSLSFHDVNNGNSPEKHLAPQEATEIKRLIKKHKDQSIGVITPFRKQKMLLDHEIGEQDSVDIGTIHSFQGDEKDVIIISPAISDGTHSSTFDWIKNNRELLNVGSTRAKKKLIVVGDYRAIKTSSGDETNDLLELCDYVKEKDYMSVQETKTDTYNKYLNSLKVMNTKFETYFLENISHLFTVHHDFYVKDKIGVKTLFKKPTVEDKALVDYYFRAEFDFVVFNAYNKRPLLAIELDGQEHATDDDVQKRDEKKETLCKGWGFTLLRIPNNYARRYQYIREAVLAILEQ